MPSRNCQNHNKGKITLGVRSAYAFRVLPFYIHEFSKLHPNLELDFIIARSDKLLSFLENKRSAITDNVTYHTNHIISIAIHHSTITNASNNIIIILYIIKN